MSLDALATRRADAPADAAVLAMDVGGTKLSAALVGPGGRLWGVDIVPTPHDPADFFRAVRDLLQPLAPHAARCGVVAAGPFLERGRVIAPVNLPGLHGLDLHDLVSEITALPTVLINDAQALALAEASVGWAVGVLNFAAVTVSTGVGAGIVVDGALLDGRNGNAGHLGHVRVPGDGRVCVCGGRDCLEAHIGGAALERVTGRPPGQAGQEVIAQCARVLGGALADLVTLLDLELVVLHGSVARGWGEPFARAVETAASEALTLPHVNRLRVELSSLGPQAGLLGAAASSAIVRGVAAGGLHAG